MTSKMEKAEPEVTKVETETRVESSTPEPATIQEATDPAIEETGHTAQSVSHVETVTETPADDSAAE